MKHKLVAISLSQSHKTIHFWQMLLENFKARISNFRNHEAPYFKADYSSKLNFLDDVFTNPSTKHIMKLISDSNFLIRKLPLKLVNQNQYYFLYSTKGESESPKITPNYYTYLGENHIALIELSCLVQNLHICWNQLNSEQIEKIINFFINKTAETLDETEGISAPCFTVFLKNSLDGLLEFQPQLEPRFREIIAKRKKHYANHPSQ